MKRNIFILIFSFLFIFAGFIKAQSLINLEKKYEQLSIQYDNESSIVDSLKIIFSKKADQIDKEKKKNNPDNEIITDLMAGSTTISNKLQDHSRKVNQIENDLENIKMQLHRIYSSKIDSLESLKKTGKADEEKVNDEILLLTAKNLLVAPKILTFSFNPSKVLNIDLNRLNDPKEKIIFREYLDNAFAEVNLLLENVVRQSDEVDQIIDLQNKTKKFLEEAELESKIFLQSQRDIASSTESAPLFNDGSGIANESREFSKQVKTYQLILRQLDIEQLSKTDIKWNVSLNEMSKNLSLKDYQSLLKEVKKRLREYKLVLANKIGSSR